jgi:hypothetical protein
VVHLSSDANAHLLVDKFFLKTCQLGVSVHFLSKNRKHIIFNEIWLHLEAGRLHKGNCAAAIPPRFLIGGGAIIFSQKTDS